MHSIYSDARTWLHDVAVGYKLMVLLLLGIGLYASESMMPLLALGVCCVLVFASLGHIGWRARRLLVPLLIACLLIVVFHAVMQNIRPGLIGALRLLSMGLMGVAFTLTTLPSDMLHTIERVLQPLDRWGLRSHRIALQLALMLRFVEHFFMVWRQLDDAHKVRTGRSGGWRLLAPLTLHMLQAAKRVADTLALRIHT
ncbi:MAG: energy-coupling factor transporter transmembrane component T family protein [Limnohabitans sp.]